MAFSSETSCEFLVLHWRILFVCLFACFLHNLLNSSAVCCSILLLCLHLPVFLWNLNTFKFQYWLQGSLLLAQLFMMCQKQGGHLWPLQNYPRCLQSIVFTSSYKFMSCRAGETLFAPNTNPLCSKVTLTTCFESSVAALLMPGCFCSSPESFLLFHRHAEGQNYMSCFFKNTLFKSSSQQSYAKFTNPQHRIFPFLSFYTRRTDFFPLIQRPVMIRAQG